MDNPEIDVLGNKFWHNDKGDIHREDGAAIEWENGVKEWVINGHTHRVGGPAVEDNNGNKEWRINGKLHREDGPAVEYLYCKEWWIDGKRHRIDGPAVEASNVFSWWYSGEFVGSSIDGFTQGDFERFLKTKEYW